MKRDISLVAVVACWLLVCFMVPSAWAEATADSSTWEGFYEADVLPSADGWTVAGNEVRDANVAGGILTLDTLHGTGVADAAMYWSKTPVFDLTAGMSVEWRVRFVSVDTPNPTINWASSMNVSDGSATMYVSAGVNMGVGALVYTASGSTSHAGNGLGGWNTVRLTAEAGQVKVYVNDMLSAVDAGAPYAGADLLLAFGDVTGPQDAVVEIDYVRWTAAGAFPASGGPATITGDSRTWESRYEADVLPGEAGFKVGNTAHQSLSVVDGDTILTIDTLSSDPRTSDDGSWVYLDSAGFDFTAGTSLEWRYKLNGYDYYHTIQWAASMTMCDLDSGKVFYFTAVNPIQAYREDGIVEYSDSDAPEGEWNTVRATVVDNEVRLYVNGVQDPNVAHPATGFDKGLFFGDGTGPLDATLEIDYVRWTNQGAFAPVDPCLCGDVKTVYLTGDISGPAGKPDCRIDAMDFAALAADWQGCSVPGQAGCEKVGGVGQIREGTATVNGDLSEWSGAQWIDLDMPFYGGLPKDVEYAKFAVRWDGTAEMIYVAVEVHDPNMVFEDYPTTEWYTSDYIEFWTQGNVAGGGDRDTFQHYWVHKGATGPWAGAEVEAEPDDYVVDPGAIGRVGLEYAVVVDAPNEKIFYELGIPQYNYYDFEDPFGTLTEGTDLVLGNVVGFDLVVGSASYNVLADPTEFGMLSENMFRGGKGPLGLYFPNYDLVDGAGTAPCGDWGYLTADIAGSGSVPDCFVDLYDFAAWAEQWLWCTDPEDAACDVYW